MSIYVVFFGGYKASKTDMELWLASAKAQRSDVNFDAIPYPPGASDDQASAVSHFTKGDQFDGVITQIGTSGADQTYIVGHSSGCAIANKMDSLLKDHTHITLVALDGFHPDDDQMKPPRNTQVWSAINPTLWTKLGDPGASLNLKNMYKLYGSRLNLYKTTSASNIWSLHFSLVNTAATDAITKDNYRSKGYAGCIANLAWLPKKK